jgi:hypothetical protein
MSFLGKSITNRFPEWSKIKKDESSAGSIIFDIIGERIEESRKTGLNYEEQKKVLEDFPLLTYPNSYKITLPNYPRDILERKINSISFSDNLGELFLCDTWSSYNLKLADAFILERVEENYTDTIASYNVNRKDYKFYENYNFKKNGKYLILDCTEVDYFYNRDDTAGFGRSIEEDGSEVFEEKYYVIIRGKDYYGKPIEEIINVDKKTTYKTKNKFYEICSLRAEEEYLKQRVISGGPPFEAHGLEGTLKIKKQNFENNSFILEDTLSLSDYNAFTKVYGEDSFRENNLKINLKENKLHYIHSYFKKDYFYHSKDNRLLSSEAEESLVVSSLTGVNEDVVDVQSIAYDYKRKLLYGINNGKKLFIWKLEKPKFSYNHFLNLSRESEISIELEKNYCELNEKNYGRVILSRPKGSIKEYCIIKRSPDGTVKFLNGTNDWKENISFFNGKDRVDDYENIVNFRFEDDNLNEYGQYDYYIVSLKESILFNNETEFLNKINNLINLDSNKVYCSKTSVIVPKMKALKEYTLDFLIDVNKENYEISFESYTNKLLIKQNNKVYSLKETCRKYYFNWLRGIIYTQDKYLDSVFSIEFDNDVTYRCEVSYE